VRGAWQRRAGVSAASLRHRAARVWHHVTLHAPCARAAPPSAGSAVFSVAKVDPVTGEIAGVFESIQPSDTDLGAKAPKDVKITGLWYAQLK
jgi:hypothetical protein